jgi:hypothetical protein
MLKSYLDDSKMWSIKGHKNKISTNIPNW